MLCSEVGVGSTFSFTLTFDKAPAPVAGAVPAVPAPTAAAEALRGCRVLLVEDHEVNRQLAQLVLENYGMVVDAAENGGAALRCFDQHRYDVILMDIQMPDMSGLDVTALMRRHAEVARARTPIIALTANAFRADNERYLAAGMDDCLAKPFQEEDLVRKILGGPREGGNAAALQPRWPAPNGAGQPGVRAARAGFVPAEHAARRGAAGPSRRRRRLVCSSCYRAQAEALH